jgi:hypothetical protein
LAEAGDMLVATRQGISDALRRLDCQPTAALHFNCVGRLIQLPDGSLSELHQSSAVVPMAGFSTLGEQYGPLQVNYTLAGLMLGEPDRV